MSKTTLLLFFSVITICLFTNCNNKLELVPGAESEPTPPAIKAFNITFVQDGKTHTVINNKVCLQKAPFDIIVDATNINGIYLNAAFEKDSKFEAPNEFDNLTSIAPKVFAEQPFNKNKELIISPLNYSYWFYNQNMDWHRYNSVNPKKEKGFIGTKTIHQIFDEGNDMTLPVEKLTETLYLFFFSMEGSFELGYHLLQRHYIEVQWITS